MIDGLNKGDEDSRSIDVPMTYEAELPTQRKFLPWHKPRKHFVREYQWKKQIESLIEGFDSDYPTLRYLGLPGNDLLDIRHFHDSICADRGMRLEFLGFNTAANPKSVDISISLHEVHQLPWITSKSDVLSDDYCQLGNNTSVAWKRAKNYGPYDVINLDLCDGFARHPPGGLGMSHYNAVAALVGLQSRRSLPWLLFLTTRVGRGDIDNEVFEILMGGFRSNLRDCERFRERVLSDLHVEEVEKLEEIIRQPEGQLSAFLMSLCKWVILLGIAENVNSKVSVSSIQGYRVSRDALHDDLMSIAFRFDPMVASPNDKMGLAKTMSEELDECALATKVVGRVVSRKCVDNLLTQNRELADRMTNEMARLLRLARYSESEYKSWVESYSDVVSSD